MTRKKDPDQEDASGAYWDESPANEEETRAFLLTRSKRTHAPIPKYFIQNPDRSLADRSAPLAEFVRNGDLRGLRALLLLHAIVSSGDGPGGWSTTLPLSVWARAFDTTKTATGHSSSTSATKILSRLEARGMIERARSGRARKVTVTLLRPDGSGDPYTRPDGKKDKFIRLSTRFWTEGWHEKLDLPTTAMLLVSLHEKPHFELPTERMPDWYGWSADTAERGLKTLRAQGLLRVDKRTKKAPLAPTGATAVNVYTMIGAFRDDLAQQDRTVSAETDPEVTGKTTVSTGADAERRLVEKYAHLPEMPPDQIPALRARKGRSRSEGKET